MKHSSWTGGVALAFVSMACVAGNTARDAGTFPTDASPEEDGSTACPMGQMRCEGTCIDPRTDLRNCGACGRTCRAGEVCSDGRCESTCGGATPTYCDGRCVDPQTDPATAADARATAA
jgi:hypothetical protein